jgi:predicted RNA-binding Zn-ribbon protein involved in translation (DUF1610 family)
MTDFITLACPSCGASLRVSSSTNSLKCDYCGHEHVVRRQGGEIAVEQINTWICPQCGTPTSVGTSFCPKCGFVLARSCPNCMTRVYINAIYCPDCGVNIKEIEEQNLIRQKERQRRRGEINLEIARLNNEISQKRFDPSKRPRRGPINTIIGVVCVILLCLPFVIMGTSGDSSNFTNDKLLAQTGFWIPFIVGIASSIVWFYFEIKRNKIIDEYIQRKVAEENKVMHMISELQEELRQMK